MTMFTNATETTITEIAEFLERKKQAKEPIALLLGSRAGGLFNNQDLYSRLAGYNLSTTGTLSSIEQFKECYRILSDAPRFSERDIYDIFKAALNSIPRYRREDDLLASLVLEGFFRFIVTTNIDALLEDAFVRKNLKQPADYRVIVPELDDSTEIFRNQPAYISLLKVFGDFDSLHYRTVGNPFELEADALLKVSLGVILTNDVLIIGYDPVWDQPLVEALPISGKSVWYINEELPEANSHLVEVLERRQGRYLVGVQGSYGNFWRNIFGHATSGGTVGRTTTPLPPIPTVPSSPPTGTAKPRKKAFISYSHSDRSYLDMLKKHLKWYLHAGKENELLDIWDDTRIGSGADWDKEIKEALATTRVAVLLVSANFLSSDFILDHELPCLLEARQKGEIRLLQFILRPCAFHRTPLYVYQAENGAQPLSAMNEHQQELIWASLAEKIYDLLKEPD